MTEETKKDAPAEMVPVAALAAVQDELSKNSDELAAAKELAEAQAAETAGLREQLAAAQALNKALEERRVAAEVRAEAASKGANFSRASSKERYRIIIDEARDKSDPPRVVVQVNGRAYDMQRNVEIDVPREVVSVLNDAIIGRAESVEDPRTGMPAGTRYVNARRFPFQNIGKSRDAAGNLLPGFEPLE